MARYRESVCRLCRRENTKLFLKGERCYSEKCSVDRRNYPPGDHGQGRIRITEYGKQLREKQKVKRTYGMLEKQFRLTFKKAARSKMATGEALLVLLERRLDNVIFRLGFGVSRDDARQLVRHNHVRVNGRKVDIPSFLVKAGDKIEIKEKSRKLTRIAVSMETIDRRGVPAWLQLDKDNLAGVVMQLPSREDVTMPIEEQLIVELYSK